MWRPTLLTPGAETPAPFALPSAVRCAGGVGYRVWAPVARSVEVEVLLHGAVARRIALSESGPGIYSGLDEEGRAGDLYRYRLDGGQSFPDPASAWQPFGVHGPSMVVDSHAYHWQTPPFARPPFRDLVIYELHVGTFTQAGTFRAAIERLPFLRELGVNAIELMPIGEFPGERNWGYDGVYLYAPARSYGHPDDLRALVDAAHAAGLAVILDVVYNHFGPDGNYLHAFIGEYLDEEAKTPWGGAIRYGSPDLRGLRELVVRNPDYWMEEYRIDGFRLDATHAIIDTSPCHLLAEIIERIHARGGYAIAEDCRNDRRLVLPVSEGGFGCDAVWADDFHHIVRVANTREREAYFADFSGTLAELTGTLDTGWFYSGQHSPFWGKPRGTPASGLSPGSCVHCLSNHDQVGNRALGERLSHAVSHEAYLAASALLCLSPHTPLLFMGQEWAASTPFLFFTDHHEELGRLVTAGRRDEFKDFAAFRGARGLDCIPDPQDPQTFRSSQLRWEEIDRPPHAQVLALYRACLHLRRGDPAFRPVKKSACWVRELPIGIGALGLSALGSEWLLLIDLVGGHGGALPELPWKISPGEWTRVLSTREARFGGDDGCALSATMDAVHFDRPEVIVLKRQAVA